MRDGAEQEIDPSHLVIDDLVRLRAGDEVPVDALVVDSDGLEVDESALTGEAEAVVKDDGDEVLSGSAVVAGSGLIVATRDRPRALDRGSRRRGARVRAHRTPSSASASIRSWK